MIEHKYKVRPSSRADPIDVLRIFLSPAELLLHKLSPGDACHIETPQGSIRPATVYPAIEKIKDDVVQTSKALQILYGMKLESRVSIRRSDAAIADAHDITLREIRQNESNSALPDLDEVERFHWAWILQYRLRKAGKLVPGMTLDRVEVNDERRSFQIQDINSSTDPILYHVPPTCKVFLGHNDSRRVNSLEGLGSSPVVPSIGVGGLDQQIEKLNDELSAYRYSPEEEEDIKRPPFGSILLYGVRGTGKSLLLQKICDAGWQSVFHIKSPYGDHKTVHQLFSDALGSQPSVIIIDDLESVVGEQIPTNLGQSMNFRQLLCQQLDRLNRTRTLVVGATSNLAAIGQDLRRAGRFDMEIQIPYPGLQSRAEILKVMCDVPKDQVHAILEKIAARTQGFVGTDLQKLTLQAMRAADKSGKFKFEPRSIKPETLIANMETELDTAVSEVQPVNIDGNGIFAKSPGIKWTDIGGQHDAKKRLEQSVVWPIKVDLFLHHCILQ